MPEASPESRHRLAFDVPPELGERTAAVLDKLREAEDPRAHVTELIAVVLELTDVGMRFYFIRPLEIARVGMVPMGVAKVGIATAGKAIPVAIRKVVSSMSKPQLLEVASFMDEILIRG